MRSAVEVKNERRVLCVFPAYTPSFGTFAHAYKLMGVSAFMPPQGLLLIAAYMPEKWQVRFIDENRERATAADFDWADAVMVSGMHVQASQIHDIARRAHAAGKITVLGGPSVSAAPEMYPEYDYLHVGELGDSTEAIIARIDECSARPAGQVIFETKQRLPLTDFPIPAYHQIKLSDYLLMSMQFSSGCPYVCEFCDIPGLYGRQPRMKTPAQVLAELDALIAQPSRPASVYFVDDNFIGNRKAAKDLLPHLIAWQKKNDYPLLLSCEATLNMAKQKDLLEMMREAQFVNVFCGIETPEAEALTAMRKNQNNSIPIMDAIRTLNSYGLEVTSGIILGLDTDSDDTEARLKAFIDLSQIPMLTMNLLQALPKTPLWDRLKKADRLVDDTNLESNVRFLRPYDEVVAMWKRCIEYAYKPERLYARYEYQSRVTYPNRIIPPAAGKLTWQNLRGAARLAVNVFFKLGVLADYRRPFWRTAGKMLRRGQIDAILGMGFITHHLIKFTREALRGEQNAAFYSSHQRDSETAQVPSLAMTSLRKSA
jgi:radical SAM superfamily enzyme YgiQ (UPF0313 family)